MQYSLAESPAALSTTTGGLVMEKQLRDRYIVLDGLDGVIDYFRTEKDALEYAQQELENHGVSGYILVGEITHRVEFIRPKTASNCKVTKL
jgi:hypothetical protein